MHITLFAISGAFIALSSGVMAIGMFSVGRSHLHTLWGIFCLIVLTWGIGIFFIGSTTDQSIAMLWWRTVHVDVAFMPVVFLHFVYGFLKRRAGTLLYICYAMASLISVLVIFTNLFIAHLRLVFGQFYYDSPPGSLYWIFVVFFLVLTIYSHAVLYVRLNELSSSDQQEKNRIRFFFLASLIGFGGASMCFLPVYQVDVYPITNFLVVVYPIMMGYAIFRYKLFDIRAAVTQGLVFLLWIFVGARLALSTNYQDFFLNGLLLGAVMILGFYLIQSIKQELLQREQIEKQEHDLESINKQQENLLHFMSHEIKGYLTKSEAGFAAITQGDFGAVSPELTSMADAALTDVRRGVRTVMDILDASNLKKGSVTYKKQAFDMKDIVTRMVDELKPAADEKHLTIDMRIAWEIPCKVMGDKEKIRDHVVRNLIDNAIKYTPNGSITIEVSRKDGTVRFGIADSGVGITPEDMARLFTEGGHGKDSIKVNVHSTGYGLFIAKTIVDAHGGTIRAESGGAGTGSRFIVELPAV